jgi:hypothetical protein
MVGIGCWSADFYDFTVKLDHSDSGEFGWFGDDALHGIRIVTGYNARTRVLYVEGAGRASAVSVDVLGPDERRLLFRRAPGGRTRSTRRTSGSRAHGLIHQAKTGRLVRVRARCGLSRT